MKIFKYKLRLKVLISNSVSHFMEDDAGISGDGEGSWAIAVLDSMESSERTSGSISAFWLTSPFGPLISGFGKEAMGDFHGVVSLGLHLTHDVVLDLMSHLSKGVLGGMCVFATSLSLGSGSVHDGAAGLLSAVTLEVIFKCVHWSNLGVWDINSSAILFARSFIKVASISHVI